MRKTRAELRNERAELVCRELRWQISDARNWDGNKLARMLSEWMKVAKKNKYERP